MAPRSMPAVLVGLLLAATGAVAQPAARPDPLDPKAEVPALRHDPALRHYRRAGDDARVDWKQANETVTRIGGWRAYAREAAAPAAPASAAAATHEHGPKHGPMHDKMHDKMREHGPQHGAKPEAPR